MKNTSMQHTEGGWPKDVDYTEQSDVKRFRKKVEKDEDYQYAMKTLVPMVQRCMKQNNTVNVYEEYFEDVETDHCSEPPFARGLAVFRDPSTVTRTATSVNWHPEGSSSGKIAVSYAVLNFQDERLNNPNMPASVRQTCCHDIFFKRQSQSHQRTAPHPSWTRFAQVLHMGHYKFQQTNRRASSTVSIMLHEVQSEKFGHHCRRKL